MRVRKDGAEWKFKFCDCMGLLSLEKERIYVLEDKRIFSIKQKGFAQRGSLPLQRKESGLNGKENLLKEYLET